MTTCCTNVLKVQINRPKPGLSAVKSLSVYFVVALRTVAYTNENSRPDVILLLNLYCSTHWTLCK